MENLLQSPILPLVLMIPVFYFLILRPKQQELKKSEKMLSSLKKGDKIMTTGGFFGVIQSMDDENILIRIGDASKVEVAKSAILKKIEKVEK